MAHCVMALSRHIRSGALYGAPRHLPALRGAWFLSIWRILVLLCFAGWWRFVAHYVGTHTMADPGIHLKFFAPHNSAALGGFCPSGHKFWLHVVALCSGLATGSSSVFGIIDILCFSLPGRIIWSLLGRLTLHSLHVFGLSQLRAGVVWCYYYI